MRLAIFFAVVFLFTNGAAKSAESSQTASVRVPLCVNLKTPAAATKLCVPFPDDGRSWSLKKINAPKAFFRYEFVAPSDKGPEAIRIAFCPPGDKSCHMWGVNQTEVDITSCRFIPGGHYCDATTKDGRPAGVAYRAPKEAGGFSALIVGYGSTETAALSLALTQKMWVKAPD